LSIKKAGTAACFLGLAGFRYKITCYSMVKLMAVYAAFFILPLRMLFIFFMRDMDVSSG